MNKEQFKQKITELSDVQDIEKLCLKFLIESARESNQVFVADLLYLLRREFERF